ncbi:MAG: pantetheine-phosphate adenylyltransferase [Candidatus Schekmanbacteria bacterium RIFCSPHIGHO2_02_FULL_38_11]|uniref:Phosphopantetheine adenylyltransferase n=1 Tax=Candidatus Schekmanbacteria bacterium RIFCSPLOWO2_12_FULL_38_15 TaxID=1817883 RepID=A0A1F7SLV1_9BACT|nr:MAG: pantetheine-phosphate adenylyltransferase [Candidatus Schekmanbacteria bacterium GWA2_38_9]OGL51760.1 MAG: pantetheine-phosphate adenylyltransferase [Candidatus Schekmanbacteria bacterium RIFCSPLOWO2_02_FULL_38_14]OGL52426.1 MAG: pantetheine-phosphate adenylyltransferase [Candidatus Schekmanbacteria bacterium RIFCSPHIGHO2_02_FULL_38_11]OGL54752.1 MAG: pantetheine-phosphate adenylyltransferase [Candidatus Schekmanbacteria bacterium RIFCSPLOWO2_12_FULL_38_15]
MPSKKIAVYPGSFDPITNGHKDIIERGLAIFDEVIVAIARNSAKKALFALKEREKMIKETMEGSKGIKVDIFDGLLVDYVKKVGAGAVIRGLRAVSDFEYEFQMAITNRKLGKKVETVFLMSTEKYSYLSSGIVKEVASYGGSISGMVPEVVIKALKKKFAKKKLSQEIKDGF